MKQCVSNVSKLLSKWVYIVGVSALFFIVLLLFADYATVYTFFEQDVSKQIDQKITPLNVRRLPIRGKVFGITYFDNNAFYTFDAIAEDSTMLHCGGFYKGVHPLPETLEGYHPANSTFLGVQINCIPLMNAENWKPVKTLMWQNTALFATMLICCAAVIALVCLYQDNWCKCRVNNGLQFMTWC